MASTWNTILVEVYGQMVHCLASCMVSLLHSSLYIWSCSSSVNSELPLLEPRTLWGLCACMFWKCMMVRTLGELIVFPAFPILCFFGFFSPFSEHPSSREYPNASELIERRSTYVAGIQEVWINWLNLQVLDRLKHIKSITLFLQETHLLNEHISRVRRMWPGQVSFTSHSRGVRTLIHKSIPFQLICW